MRTSGAILVVCLAALAACSGDATVATSTQPINSPECFIAFDSQLAGFRSWSSYSFEGAADAGVHVSGPRTEFVNALPAPTATTFPNGTIIVKEVGANDPSNHHLFVMSKRGCGFNADGARGWEYMELSELQGKPTILWRGVEPPAGEHYGASGSCNSCHTGCSENDSVCSSHIRLGSTP